MPVFEYRCATCKARFSVLVGMVSTDDEARCPKCGGVKVSKLVSRFARFRGEDDRIDEMADRLEGLGEPDSPSEMRQVMREMGKAMDEDVSDDMEELFEADMAGELDEDG